MLNFIICTYNGYDTNRFKVYKIEVEFSLAYYHYVLQKKKITFYY